MHAEKLSSNGKGNTNDGVHWWIQIPDLFKGMGLESIVPMGPGFLYQANHMWDLYQERVRSQIPPERAVS